MGKSFQHFLDIGKRIKVTLGQCIIKTSFKNRVSSCVDVLNKFRLEYLIDISINRLFIGWSSTVCPRVLRNGTSEPTTTKNRKEMEAFSQMGQFFCPVPDVLLGGQKQHFLVWKVGELNYQCKQASQANKHSIYLDVYGETTLLLKPIVTCLWTNCLTYVESSPYRYLINNQFRIKPFQAQSHLHKT